MRTHLFVPFILLVSTCSKDSRVTRSILQLQAKENPVVTSVIQTLENHGFSVYEAHTKAFTRDLNVIRFGLEILDQDQDRKISKAKITVHWEGSEVTTGQTLALQNGSYIVAVDAFRMEEGKRLVVTAEAKGYESVNKWLGKLSHPSRHIVAVPVRLRRLN